MPLSFRTRGMLQLHKEPKEGYSYHGELITARARGGRVRLEFHQQGKFDRVTYAVTMPELVFRHEELETIAEACRELELMHSVIYDVTKTWYLKNKDTMDFGEHGKILKKMLDTKK